MYSPPAALKMSRLLMTWLPWRLTLKTRSLAELKLISAHII